VPQEFIDAKLYELFGGWTGLQRTPRLVVKRQRLRLIAEGQVEYDRYKEQEKQQKKAEREAEMARLRGR